VTINLNQAILRRPEPRDVEQLYVYRNDWDVIRSLGGFSRGYSQRDLTDWVEYHRTRQDEIIWTIADREADRCLGHAGLYQIDHRVRSAEFAIIIGDKSRWGHGLGRAVTQAVLDFGFAQMNLNRIELTVLENNAAALHLYRKLGFVQEGVLRQAQFRDGAYLNVVQMGLLREEYRSGET
jgi:RimJ/RimL family protein N-acetyltransferase